MNTLFLAKDEMQWIDKSNNFFLEHTVTAIYGCSFNNWKVNPFLGFWMQNAYHAWNIIEIIHIKDA